MISQHWFKQWLGATKQQVITYANVDLDLCHHMTSLGRNELLTFIINDAQYILNNI